jgi:hypothetical protein
MAVFIFHFMTILAIRRPSRYLPSLLAGKQVNKAFIAALPDAKRAIMIVIVTNSEFLDFYSFPDQISLRESAIRCYGPDVIITIRDIAGFFSCNLSSVHYQIKRIKRGEFAPSSNDHPPFLSQKAYKMVKKTYHQFFRTPRSRDNHFSH